MEYIESHKKNMPTSVHKSFVTFPAFDKINSCHIPYANYNMISSQNEDRNNSQTFDEMENCSNISIINVIYGIKYKFVICLHKYKKQKKEIIFDQPIFCGKTTTCEKFTFLLHKKSKNNLKMGLCPCEMNKFMEDIIYMHKNDYTIYLLNGLKINLNDITWPRTNNNTINMYIDNISLHKSNRGNKKALKESVMPTRHYFLAIGNKKKPNKSFEIGNTNIRYMVYKIFDLFIRKNKYINLCNSQSLISFHRPSIIVMPYCGYKIIPCCGFKIFSFNIIEMKMLINKMAYNHHVYYQTITYM